MADFRLDQGRIQFRSREEAERDKQAQKEHEARERSEREEKFPEEHPAGYLAARQTEPGFRDAGHSPDGGFSRAASYREGGFDHGRGAWGAPGEVQASASVHAKPMEQNSREPTRTERAGHPGRDEPGYGAHGMERLSDDPRAFNLSGGPPHVGVDEQLRDEIDRELRKEPDLDARHVQVDVQHGEAFLTGSVPAHPMETRAERVSQRVQGIRRVHNGLTIMQLP
jgi:hypothetical protein